MHLVCVECGASYRPMPSDDGCPMCKATGSSEAMVERQSLKKLIPARWIGIAVAVLLVMALLPFVLGLVGSLLWPVPLRSSQGSLGPVLLSGESNTAPSGHSQGLPRAARPLAVSEPVVRRVEGKARLLGKVGPPLGRKAGASRCQYHELRRVDVVSRSGHL